MIFYVILLLIAANVRFFAFCATFSLDKLPEVLKFKVFDFLDDKGICAARSSLREDVENYLRERRLKKVLCGLSVTRMWQLSCLLDKKNGDFSMETVLFHVHNPIYCRDHIKLLRFLSIYPEFIVPFTRLRQDRNGFILKMKNMYSQRIHGLEQFLEVMGLEAENKSNRSEDVKMFYWDTDDNINVFIMLMMGLKCMQL